MDDLQQALAALGLSWGDVWRLVADRRAGTLVVVAGDGRKLVKPDEEISFAALSDTCLLYTSRCV